MCAHQCPDILQVRLSKVGNDIIKILKAEGLTARHLNGEGAPQLQVTPNPPSLLAPLPDVLVQEQVVAIYAGVQLHGMKEVYAQGNLATQQLGLAWYFKKPCVRLGLSHRPIPGLRQV